MEFRQDNGGTKTAEYLCKNENLPHSIQKRKSAFPIQKHVIRKSKFFLPVAANRQFLSID